MFSFRVLAVFPVFPCVLDCVFALSVKMRCIVAGCGNNSDATMKHGLDIRFHSFPSTNISLVDSWRCLCAYAGPVNRNTGICSDHFTKDQYQSTGKRARIKANAIPSLKLPGLQFDEEHLIPVSMDDSGCNTSYVPPPSVDCGIQTEYVHNIIYYIPS